ncbi:MAG: hypothetical protein FJW20_02490 [Acidimicrobiia bacterium]|nr:hypothetical protein [Acidimicrobiia bacterium]
MDSKEKQNRTVEEAASPDMRMVIRNVIAEFMDQEKSKSEPAYKAELLEERKRREQLEVRLNQLAEENRRSRSRAEEAERSTAIRSELQRLGVKKVDLAFKIVKDDIVRGEDGSLVVRSTEGPVGLQEYLTQFVDDNPEFLPARMVGGSGATTGQRETSARGSSFDLDKIRPGMDPEELESIRQEISRVALQTMRGN